MVKRTKRFFEGDGVSDSDSNSGMKEAYDADQLAENFDDYGSKKGAGAAGTSESTTEEAGGAMLKAMRDKESAPKAKPAMPALGMNDFKAAPSKPKNPNFSNEGRSTPAPAAKPPATTKSKTAQADRDAEMAARRERTMGAIKSAGSFLADLPGKAMENYRSTRPGYKKQKEKEAAYTGNFSKGGSVSASSRADGIAQRGKTRGKMC
jgi:hypothetical protein